MSIDFRNHLFNFAHSAEGGGLKRLLAFAEWFAANGGAHFIVHPNLRNLLDDKTNNTYHYVNVSLLDKFRNSQKYVDDIIWQLGRCEFYYSYNIPLTSTINANKKWFHLSNVLPFVVMSGYGVPLRRQVELLWLRRLTRKGLPSADFISAESEFSLEQLKPDPAIKTVVSVNGADREIGLASIVRDRGLLVDEAIVVGTYYHKNLADSYSIFKFLRQKTPDLKMVLAGGLNSVPQYLRDDPDVELLGVVDNKTLCSRLARARYYINTSKIENSWNSASEGVFLADQSYLSAIPPHKELLGDLGSRPPHGLHTNVPLIYVRRGELDLRKLKPWNDIIHEMIEISLS